MNNPVLSQYLCNDCEENGIGVSVHSDIQQGDYVIIKVDDYFNKEIHPNPAGNDCLIVQRCVDNRYKVYLIELKNIQTLRHYDLSHIRDKFQNCFDILMSDKFRSYFYDPNQANSIFKCNRLINRFLVIKSQKAIK